MRLSSTFGGGGREADGGGGAVVAGTRRGVAHSIARRAVPLAQRARKEAATAAIRRKRYETRRSVGGDPGFVLLELVLALVVVSLIAALALPRAREDGLGSVRSKAMEIAALLRADRNLALRSGRPVVSLVDPYAHMVRSSEAARSVAVPARYGFVVSDSLANGVRFDPDGRARGGEIRLAAPASPGGVSVVIRVDPLTAMVDLREDEPSHDG